MIHVGMAAGGMTAAKMAPGAAVGGMFGRSGSGAGYGCGGGAHSLGRSSLLRSKPVLWHQTRTGTLSVQASTKHVDEPSGSSVTTKPSLQSTSPKMPNLQQPTRIPYKIIAALSSAGAVETAYLSWIKIFGGSAACPAGGPGCNDVLNSEYSTVFGVPLSVIGLVGYTSISLLAFTMLQTKSAEEEAKWLFLGATTALTAASGYFMYLLTYKLEGASCAYCVASAVISLSLFLSTLRGFRLKDLPQMASLQLAVVATVILALSTAFADSTTALAGLSDLDLPPVEPEVTTSSDPTKISLAKHLKSIGAKMYGAFWCSHCHEQKQTLGQEAVKFLDYIECYPEGYRKGVEIAKACEVAKIDGFPTWIIKGQTYSGELSLEELANAAGFTLPK